MMVEYLRTLFFNVLDGKDIIMNSDGTAVRAFCYISDAIVGIFKVLQDGENSDALQFSK